MLSDSQVVQIQGVSYDTFLTNFKEIVKDEVKKYSKVQTGTTEAPDRYVSRAEAKEICGKVSDPTMWAWEVAGIIKGE